MHSFDIIFIALALSIDAFAVALAASAAGHLRTPRAAVRIAFHFGLFQFLMPVLGWAAGATLAPLIQSVDHWVAFGLLAFVGGRMIHAARRDDDVPPSDDPSRGVSLVMLSTAVSVDALAVGLTLAMLGVEILLPAAVIGIVTATISLIGVFLGAKMHVRFGKIAETLGGVVLIVIGLRVVISHLFGI